jgi:uncharacterized RDD family membrane protein YckC
MNELQNEQLPVGTRLGAMILDHVFMMMLMIPFAIPSLIAGFSAAFTVSHTQTDSSELERVFDYLTMFGFSIYFCKDIVNGRSLAKRVLKLQLVDNSTGKVASPFQCLVRNVFCIIWPLEVIVSMVNTSRRLGDRIAGTKLIGFDASLQQPKLRIVKLLIPVLISYGLVVLVMQITPEITLTKPAYIESSYNQADSKKLEKLFNDSLGQIVVPDIRIYDSVQDLHLKYVSIILSLKANYLADEEKYDMLHSRVMSLIDANYQIQSFTGNVKYTYQGSGQFQSRSTGIGTMNLESKR